MLTGSQLVARDAVAVDVVDAPEWVLRLTGRLPEELDQSPRVVERESAC